MHGWVGFGGLEWLLGETPQSLFVQGSLQALKLGLFLLQILGSASSLGARFRLRGGGWSLHLLLSGESCWGSGSLILCPVLLVTGNCPCHFQTVETLLFQSRKAAQQWLSAACSVLPPGPFLMLLFPFGLSSGKALQTVTQNLQRLQALGQSGQSWPKP